MSLIDKVNEALAKHNLHPHKMPLGKDHHTGVPFNKSDEEIAELAYWLGGIFIDVEDGDPNMPLGETYWHKEMTSVDIWKRVARALRIHGLKIVDAS